MERNIAIILAAGQGKRMLVKEKKQYLLMDGKPMLYYAIKAFEDSKKITDIILVVGKSEKEYVQTQLLSPYPFQKIRGITEGGKERYHSVFCGLQAITEFVGTKTQEEQSLWNVFIHDGARPFVKEEIIERAYRSVKKEKACVVGMKVKDTIKIADEEGYIRKTPARNLVWQVQTPQVFSYPLVKEAYEKLCITEDSWKKEGIVITDDAMVVETFGNHKVKLVEGAYENIKITTPEDLLIGEAFLGKMAEETQKTGK